MVCTSLEPALLSSEAQLLAYYHAELSTRLEKRLGPPPGNPVAGDSSSLGGDRDDGGVPADAAAVKGGAAGASWYPFEEFMEDYRVAFLDYVRQEEYISINVCIETFWVPVFFLHTKYYTPFC